jgi:acetyl-CoA carboxylase biotin carboxyl carrier protein
VNLTHDDVQEILRILESSSFDELHLETDRFKLVLRRSRGEHGGWTQERHTLAAAREGSPVTAHASREVQAAAAAAANAAMPAETAQAVSASDGLADVRAPIIGTFYRAPKPGAAPFVEAGSHVTEDSVVGIVETMKLMNSVYAGTRGEVIEICAQNAQFVEQDHVLMRIRPVSP